MATTNPPPKTGGDQQPKRLPPEEKFWQRYSPHQEMPLSAITSFGLHFLTIGALIVLAWLGWLGFRNSGGSIPVEPVRFAGGGGNPRGEGSGPGIGTGPEAIEAKAADPKENQQPQPDPDPARPRLDAPALAKLPDALQKDNDFVRFVQNGNPNVAKVFGSIDETVRDKLRDGLQPGKGQGGTGEGGGKGTGKGTGEGAGAGEGRKGNLSQREKRMLRWTMIFNTRSGRDYLDQLRGLGAILAVPTTPDNKSYKVIRNLAAPRLLDEDISKIERIFWIDDRPESVMSVMGALRLNIMPSHFVAFMPPELEKLLFEIEKKASGGVPEDRIQETKFGVQKIGNRYVPQVLDVKVMR